MLFRLKKSVKIKAFLKILHLFLATKFHLKVPLQWLYLVTKIEKWETSATSKEQDLKNINCLNDWIWQIMQEYFPLENPVSDRVFQFQTVSVWNSASVTLDCSSVLFRRSVPSNLQKWLLLASINCIGEPKKEGVRFCTVATEKRRKFNWRKWNYRGEKRVRDQNQDFIEKAYDVEY